MHSESLDYPKGHIDSHHLLRLSSQSLSGVSGPHGEKPPATEEAWHLITEQGTSLSSYTMADLLYLWRPARAVSLPSATGLLQPKEALLPRLNHWGGWPNLSIYSEGKAPVRAQALLLIPRHVMWQSSNRWKVSVYTLKEMQVGYFFNTYSNFY